MRPAWVEIDLKAIEHNVSVIRALTKPGTLFMAVVKANGYGHGASQTTRAALAAGADRLGVSLLDEAMQLKNSGINAPIHILSETPPEPADSRCIATNGFVATVCREETARALAAAGKELDKPVKVHVKVDTGMNRIGLHWNPDFVAGYIKVIKDMPGLNIEGIFTHLATADDPASDFKRIQLDRFIKVLDTLRAQGICPPVKHTANSAAIIDFPESHLDMVRAGNAIYGLDPSPAFAGRIDLIPSLSLKAKVSFVKDVQAGEGVSYGLKYTTDKPRRLATLPLGYADGYSRRLSGRAEVIIHGRKAPVIGTICMDMFLVDVTGIPDVYEGTEAVLIGSDGGESITAGDVAAHLGTINYEVVCMISARVPRIYLT
jgi:alanine racemase